MPNGMDYSLKNRVIDGTGMILDTEPGTPDDVGTYVTENQLADWIKGKILFTGYYHNGNFYSDSGHTTLLAKVNGALYIDQTNANKALYVCLSSTYQSLTEEAQVQAIRTELQNGTLVPLKATQDSLGNQIDTTYAKKADLLDGTIVVKEAEIASKDEDGNNIKATYETKADASDLKSAIQGNSQRIENLEVAVSGSLVQTNTDATMANTKTITNANSILPWAILKRVGARSTQFNQLIHNTLADLKAINTSGTWNDNVYTKDNLVFTFNTTNLSITVTGTSGASDFDFNLGNAQTISGQKYLLIGSPTTADATKWYLTWGLMGADYNGGGRISDGNGNSIFTKILVRANQTLSNDVFRPQLFDLTAMSMYDSGKSDAENISLLKMKYPSIYPYNAGSIIPLNPSAFKVVGFNKWDEVWEAGTISSSDGGDVDGGFLSTRIRGKNYIRCFPSTSYYGTPITGGLVIVWYDANKNFISAVGTNGSAPLTSPPNAFYFRLTVNDAYGNVYRNDICFNLSKLTGSPKNGDYVPYEEQIIDTSFTSDYKYVNPSCHDYSENVLVNGVMRREEHKGIVGSITYDGSSDENWEIGGLVSNFYIQLNTLMKASSYIGKILCDRLETVSSNFVQTSGAGIMSISGYSDSGSYPSQNWLYVKITESITTTSELKTWLAQNPITVNFALATPSTPTLHDPIPNIPCEDGTTITAITPQTDLVNAIDVPNTIAYMTKIGG